MIDLECPNCGRMGSVPNDKANSRLVCKKCHRVFHMSPTGRPMLGEPPPPGKEKDRGPEAMRKAAATATKAKIDWTESLLDSSGTRTKGLLALLVVGVLGLGYLVFGGGSKDILVVKAEQAAKALADEQLPTLQGFATSATATDVPKWYETVHSAVDDLKKSSPTHKILPNVFVLEENHAAGNGEVLISLAPETGSARDKRIAVEAGASADKQVTQVMTFWILDRGSWRLDATRTGQSPPLSTRR